MLSLVDFFPEIIVLGARVERANGDEEYLCAYFNVNLLIKWNSSSRLGFLIRLVRWFLLE